MRKMRRLARVGLVVISLLTAGIHPLPAQGWSPDKGPDAVRGGQDHRPAHITILRQPISQTVVAGQWTVLSVEAVGKPRFLHYQWRKDGQAVGWNLPFLVIPGAAPRHAGTYTVTISNPTGSVTSATAVVSVNVPPSIEAQPQGQTVAQGGNASLSVVASGSGNLSFQWRKDASPIAGAVASTYQIVNTQPADAGSYDVVVSNTLNGTVTRAYSRPAVLRVHQLPVISQQPASQTQVVGLAASFSVSAASPSGGELGYQWLKDGNPIPGATEAGLSIPSVAASDRGTYSVLVSSTLNGTVVSTLSASAQLWVNVPPVIVTQPQGQSVRAGNPVTFSLTATAGGEGSLSYQWMKDGVPVPEATAASFTLPNVTIADAGSYVGVVTNTLNGTTTSISSEAAVLNVQVPPTIQVQPETQIVAPPDAVTFTVVASSHNGGTLSYQWKKDGVVIPDAVSASYTVPSTEFVTNGISYTVVVSEGDLSVESQPVQAIASVASPVFAGDPVPVIGRPLTVLPSFHVDTIKFPNGSFRLGYDEYLKNPVWTAYVNFPVQQPYPNSDGDYNADPRLAAPQVGKNDYTGIYTGGANSPTSYDRGHMVPRADVSYRYTPVAGDDATMMSNLVPQISQFNQQTWQRLETAIGGSGGGTTNGLTATKGRIWVYTGSVFTNDPTWWNSTVTPGLRIAIPVACYKIVVSEETPGHPKALAMLMPNAWGMVNSNATLTNHVTSVARIESLTGLNFFPGMSSKAPGLDIPTWKATVDVRGWGTPFEQASGPNAHMLQPSWDLTIPLNETVTFEGAGTPAKTAPGATLTSATWNFGDGSPAVNGLTATHAYAVGGTFTATFTVQDSLGSATTVSRVIKVTGGNTPPTFNGPSNLTTTDGTAVTAAFSVSDDQTDGGAIQVTASVDNTTLVPGALTVTNNAGNCSLILAPAYGLTGTATVTLTATDGNGASTTKTFTLTVNPVAASGFIEGFEKNAKSSYAAGDATLPSGVWNLNDALIGNLAADKKNGTWSVRVRNTGKVTMQWDVPTGAQSVTVQYAKYGTDATSTWQLWYSTDGGSAWIQAGGDMTSEPTALTAATFQINYPGPVRFEIRKISGGSARINFDDFQVVGY